MDEIVGRFEAEYCPPIDPALFSAIVSDYDLDDSQSALEAKATLDSLKATAVEEEATGFDASGSSSLQDSHNQSPGYPASAPDETTESTSRDTDLTSLSNGLSSVDLGSETSPDPTTHDLETLDTSTKIALLKELFPSLSEFTISHTLAHHASNWKPTLDDLLNQVYFSEDGTIDGKEKVSAKGIDAFSEDKIAKRGRKGKKGGKNLKANDALRSASLPNESQNPVNKWKTANDDVEFISDRANIPATIVRSLYNQQDHSVPRTVTAILKNFLHEDSESEDPGVQVEAYELGQDFPSIAPNYLTALIKLTHPSTSAAHELAKAMTKTQSSSGSGSLAVIPHYAPIQLDDDNSATSGDQAELSTSAIDSGTASSATLRLSAARHTAMEQARAAYRKSKSDRLMAGAAGYYSQVGRDYGSSLQQHNAAAADALVASQSSANEIDLHGVTVQDAVRIARQRTHRWWNGLGESKVNGRIGAVDRAVGFRIVTGIGRHSAGGRGVLGPAVKKGLEQDGWRVESGSGVITVKGKARIS